MKARGGLPSVSWVKVTSRSSGSVSRTTSGRTVRSNRLEDGETGWWRRRGGRGRRFGARRFADGGAAGPGRCRGRALAARRGRRRGGAGQGGQARRLDAAQLRPGLGAQRARRVLAHQPGHVLRHHLAVRHASVGGVERAGEIGGLEERVVAVAAGGEAPRNGLVAIDRPHRRGDGLLPCRRRAAVGRLGDARPRRRLEPLRRLVAIARRLGGRGRRPRRQAHAGRDECSGEGTGANRHRITGAADRRRRSSRDRPAPRAACCPRRPRPGRRPPSCPPAAPPG